MKFPAVELYPGAASAVLSAPVRSLEALWTTRLIAASASQHCAKNPKNATILVRRRMAEVLLEAFIHSKNGGACQDAARNPTPRAPSSLGGARSMGSPPPVLWMTLRTLKHAVRSTWLTGGSIAGSREPLRF